MHFRAGGSSEHLSDCPDKSYASYHSLYGYQVPTQRIFGTCHQFPAGAEARSLMHNDMLQESLGFQLRTV